MDDSILHLAAVAIAALTLGVSALLAYVAVHRSIPKKHRLRAFMFVMTLPLVVIAIATTENPLPALLTAIQASWPTGPSG